MMKSQISITEKPRVGFKGIYKEEDGEEVHSYHFEVDTTGLDELTVDDITVSTECEVEELKNVKIQLVKYLSDHTSSNISMDF